MNIKRLLTGVAALTITLTLMACGGNSEQQAQETSESGSTQQQTMSQAPPAQKLNLNTASEEEFMSIPGVGETMVHEFEEYRPYISIQQFRKEISKYVDMEQVRAYEQYVYVPVDPNECDAATLQQIPGLDESEAQQLIEARPFDSQDAFLQQLSDFVNEEQLATAETYLASE
ncbi:MAG: helix-hairpin-helix domain-containing protein [Balneolaceae bacterium]|nr:helix-hairpin-helix domain-containing protein [Balneolaceae bacterium]